MSQLDALIRQFDDLIRLSKRSKSGTVGEKIAEDSDMKAKKNRCKIDQIKIMTVK
jgi:hypothetical protein